MPAPDEQGGRSTFHAVAEASHPGRRRSARHPQVRWRLQPRRRRSSFRRVGAILRAQPALSPGSPSFRDARNHRCADLPRRSCRTRSPNWRVRIMPPARSPSRRAPRPGAGRCRGYPGGLNGLRPVGVPAGRARRARHNQSGEALESIQGWANLVRAISFLRVSSPGRALTAGSSTRARCSSSATANSALPSTGAKARAASPSGACAMACNRRHWICRTHARAGHLTVLGRNGSDYPPPSSPRCSRHGNSRSGDTDGVLSADPRLVPDATRRRRISATTKPANSPTCAKVIHPQTLTLIARGLPVRIRNTFDPDHLGPRRCHAIVLHERRPAATAGEDRAPPMPVKGISAVQDLRS